MTHTGGTSVSFRISATTGRSAFSPVGMPAQESNVPMPSIVCGPQTAGYYLTFPSKTNRLQRGLRCKGGYVI